MTPDQQQPPGEGAHQVRPPQPDPLEYGVEVLRSAGRIAMATADRCNTRLDELATEIEQVAAERDEARQAAASAALALHRLGATS